MNAYHGKSIWELSLAHFKFIYSHSHSVSLMCGIRGIDTCRLNILVEQEMERGREEDRIGARGRGRMCVCV